MITKHLLLYYKVGSAIDDLVSDNSVPLAETLDSLQTLVEQLEIKIEALKYDIEALGGDDE